MVSRCLQLAQVPPAAPACWLVLWLLGSWIPAPAAATAEAAEAVSYLGRPVQEVLSELQSEGLPIVFSSAVVGPELLVMEEPRADRPEDLLKEVLRPHGLGVRRAGGRLVVVPLGARRAAAVRGEVRSAVTRLPIPGARVELVDLGRSVITDRHGRFALRAVAAGRHPLRIEATAYSPLRTLVAVAAGEGAVLDLALEPSAIASEEIVVSSSGIPASPVAPVSGVPIRRRQLLDLPGVASDALRLLGHLPGIEQQFSARPLVRGGGAGEVGIELDGVELYEPYHLPDFGGQLSIVPAGVLSEVELDSAGLDARWGDRMSGVLRMTTLEPSWRLRGELEAGPLAFGALASGQRGAEGVRWLASARYGALIAVAEALDLVERPSFSDLFAKSSTTLGSRHDLTVSLLLGHDGLNLDEETASTKRSFDTRYDSRYLWLGHRVAAGSRTFLESVFSLSTLERDRRGLERAPGEENFVLADRRDLVTGLARLDVSTAAGSAHTIAWGAEARVFDADFDYQNEIAIETPLGAVRTNPTHLATDFAGALRGRQQAVYAQDEWRPTAHLALLFGLRLEDGTLWDRGRANPRLRLTHQATDRLRWSVSFGDYSQSHRPYELQVEDGESQLRFVQHADELAVGIEHRLGAGWFLRAEAFDRLVEDPQPRWVNLFDPLALALEAEEDRVRLEPSRIVSQGVLVSLSRRFSDRFDLSVSGSTIRADEHASSGTRSRETEVPFDLRLRAFYRPSSSWRLGVAGKVRSGWPTTRLRLAEAVAPVPGLELGPLYGERFPTIASLDVQVVRTWTVRRGSLELQVDLENATDHTNVRGVEYELTRPDGVWELERRRLTWVGVLPSFKVRWSF